MLCAATGRCGRVITLPAEHDLDFPSRYNIESRVYHLVYRGRLSVVGIHLLVSTLSLVVIQTEEELEAT